MKKSIVFFVFICMTLFLSSCLWDLYSDMRPYDYGDAKWVCESPNIYFVVDTTREKYYFSSVGEIEIDSNMYPCRFCFIHQTNQVGVDIIGSPDSSHQDIVTREFWGECIFSPEKLIIKIDKKRDTIFEGQYDEMVFIRTNTENEESVI